MQNQVQFSLLISYTPSHWQINQPAPPLPLWVGGVTLALPEKRGGIPLPYTPYGRKLPGSGRPIVLCVPPTLEAERAFVKLGSGFRLDGPGGTVVTEGLYPGQECRMTAA